MASASELRSRINGIRDTKKITDAMYMVSSAKMQRALRELEKTSPYFEALSEKMGELIDSIPHINNRYFRVTPPENDPHLNHGVILITSDKGLAGPYNEEAIRMCESYLKLHHKITLFIIGEYGRQYFLAKKQPFEENFHYCSVLPRLTDAQRICAEILEYYDEEKLDAVSIIYTEYIGARPGECKRVSLLPLEKTRFHKSSRHTDEKEFLPSPHEVLSGIVPSYLSGFIYGCLVESFCSEQQSRMIAMKSAGDNAEKMLKKLQLQYNQLRQTAITNEMIEITAGVKALKKKRTMGQTGDESNEG